MNRFICLCTTRKFVMRLGAPCRLTVKKLGWDRRIGQCYDNPKFPSTYSKKQRLISYLSTYISVISSYIMIFQVSTGRSASLNDQSNFSSATGSSVGSWYGARYSWASASPALIRFLGSKTSIRSSKSIAKTRQFQMWQDRRKEGIPAGSAFLNLAASGWRSRFGRDCTNRRV